jgi:hypothetical protein
MYKRRTMNKLVIPFLLFYFAGFILVGQSTHENEQGFPFIKNFTSTDYKAHAQNFAIVRDREGIMYFGNFAGVLQYDGEFWRLIPTEKTTKVSALGIDSVGNIYVGALGEIGMLESGRIGERYFKSLIPSSGPATPTFQDVLQIFPTPDGVYFITKKIIFRWQNGQLYNWKPEYEIIAGFNVNQTLYMQVKDKGLMIFRNGALIPVTNGSLVSGAIEIKAALPYPDNQVLIATGTQGLYILDSNGVREYITPSDEFFMKNLITCAIALYDGSFAIGTSRKGVIIIYPDGQVKQPFGMKMSRPCSPTTTTSFGLH